MINNNNNNNKHTECNNNKNKNNHINNIALSSRLLLIAIIHAVEWEMDEIRNRYLLEIDG